MQSLILLVRKFVSLTLMTVACMCLCGVRKVPLVAAVSLSVTGKNGVIIY